MATIGATQPLLVMVFNYLLVKERPAGLALVARAGGIIGVGLLVFDPHVALDSLGVIAAFSSAICMALGMALTKIWRAPVGLLPFTGWQLVAGGLILLPIAFIFERPFPTLTAAHLGGYLWLTGVNTALAYWIWFSSIQRLQSFQVSFIGLLTPVVAVMVGYVFLSQGFALQQLVGVVIILASIVLAQVPSIVANRRQDLAPLGA